MSDNRFSIQEAISYGWNTFKAKAGFFIGLTLATFAVTAVPDFIAGRLFDPGSVMLFVASLLIRLFGLFVGMVTTLISLQIYDTGEADFSQISALLPQYLPYLFGKILYGLIVTIGLILLIVPGLIVSYMFLYVGYLIVDRGLGPIEALKESKAVTDGSKWRLFLFSLVIAGINILGILCVGVGLLVTIPLSLMASVYVYRQLSPKQA